VRNWTQLQFFSLFHCECELWVIIDVIDVMICSLQSVNLLYLLYGIKVVFVQKITFILRQLSQTPPGELTAVPHNL